MTLDGLTSGIYTLVAPSIAGTTTNPAVSSNAISAPGFTAPSTQTLIAPSTYFQTEGYAGTTQSVPAANTMACAGFIVPPGGLSVGHLVIDIITADATHNVDIGFYNGVSGISFPTAGTLEAHIGAQAITTTGNLTLALSGGTQTLQSGKTYFCVTNTNATPTLAFNMRTQSATFYPYAAITGTTTGGALNSTITLPTDAPSASSAAISPNVVLIP